MINELIEQIGERKRLIDTANEDIQFFESVRQRRGKLFDLEEEKLALIRIALNALTTTPPAASLPDGWIKCSDRMPKEKGKYLTQSSYGTGTSWFEPTWSSKFQDCDTNSDEGMENFEGEVFRVTHWMALPAAPAPGGE